MVVNSHLTISAPFLADADYIHLGRYIDMNKMLTSINAGAPYRGVYFYSYRGPTHQGSGLLLVRLPSCCCDLFWLWKEKKKKKSKNRRRLMSQQPEKK
jgi:hypothetical protein